MESGYFAIKNETFDELPADCDPQAILFDELKKALAERVLDAELDHHLERAALELRAPSQ